MSEIRNSASLPVNLFPNAPACIATRHKLIEHLMQERELFLCDAVRILGSRDRAEDVLQDAALRCLSSRAITMQPNSPRGLLRRMVRNLALDHWRRNGYETSMDDTTPEPVASGPTAEQSLVAYETLSAMARAIVALPETQKHAFTEHRLKARRQNEIASEMGLSPARVHALIHSAQAYLANELGEDA
jgi:RNA polymerase sigma-70 factor (ECF subfamily)